MKLLMLVALLSSLTLVRSKAVFAHFMVGNTASYSTYDWEDDINKAQIAHIDAFALNIANNDSTIAAQLPTLFSTAGSKGFKLFFSFDYAGNGAWLQADVIALVNQYKMEAAYYFYNGQAFSFLGAKAAVAIRVPNCLFSWGPGLRDQMIYLQQLIIPIFNFFAESPTYCQLPPDSLPIFLDITKTGYGGEMICGSIGGYKSGHYIGPNRAKAWSLFDSSYGKAQYNYADGFPHDGWRQFLPYVIDIYKTGAATITEEAEIVQNKIFFTALLGSTATVKATVGGVDQAATWTRIPDGNVGLYHGNVTYKGIGPVIVTVLRDGTRVAKVSGGSISIVCTDSIENLNPWVGSDTGLSVSVVALAYLLTVLHCVRGIGPGDYAELCALVCTYDYCSIVCTCTKVGNLRTNILKATNLNGYPAAGLPKACVTIANKNDCNPPAASAAPIPFCTGGTGIDTDWNSLCSFTCKYNNCPNKKCICTSASFTENTAPTYSTLTGYPADKDGQDYGLCEWACNRGFYPFPPCSSTAPLADIGEDVTSFQVILSQSLPRQAKQIAWPCLPTGQPVSTFHSAPLDFERLNIAMATYDADRNAYTADGCTGGSKGFNCAFCVETDVSLGQCNWRGTATSCSQTCKAGEFLLTQNTHIAYAKAGCKAGHFSSLCCEKIEVPSKDLVTCPYTNLNNVITGGHGPVVRAISNSKAYLGGSQVPAGECIYNPVGNALYMGGTRWGVADFKPTQNKPPQSQAKDIDECDTWLADYHTTSLLVTSIVTINCDEDNWPQTCAYYNSVGSVMILLVITCPWQNQGSKDKPVPFYWNSQHYIEVSNTTHRANNEDVFTILQILGNEFLKDDCEYDDFHYSGPNIINQIQDAM
ncbi:alpha-glucanase [Botrytis cinerea]